ncbi:hypothetical protein CIT292_09768 [Citrobacter youngae ATCC 29220]|uniref:Uncharacterized protein n=1 Tax=Citrobacter youngae ATCC 29220 TaxID=500640 RepID=D4BGW3_9ENTR|nr:hypothetical protein CIT292_09768 [Citrobacter youngae ATCC 29220]
MFPIASSSVQKRVQQLKSTTGVFFQPANPVSSGNLPEKFGLHE